MSQEKKPKFLFLESLRGIGAIFVSLYHLKLYGYSGPLTQNPLTQSAWFFVDFFFVLSGFVIAYSYLGKLNTFSDIIFFQKKRFFRLYPLHFIMLILFLILECFKFAGKRNYLMHFTLTITLLKSTPLL